MTDRESFASKTKKLLDRHAVFAIFLVALGLRSLFVFLYGPSAPPVTWGDDSQYDAIASKLVMQHEYANTWYPPGYPIFLATVYSLFGRSWLAVRVLQAIMGAATCMLTVQLSNRFFSRRTAIVAGLLLAFYPGHIYWSWRIMGESLYMFLLMWAVLLAASLSPQPRFLRAMTLGLVTGYAQLTKSNLFLFPIALVVWFLSAARVGMAKRACYAIAVTTGIAVMYAITPLANLISPTGKAGFLPGNAGAALWYSNNPLANGYFIPAEYTLEGKVFIERHGLTQRLQEAGPAAKDRILRNLALTWIRENPGKFCVLGLKKLNNSFGLFPRAALFERDPRAPWLHLVTYGPVAAFALAGLIMTRRRWRDLSLLYLALLSYVVSVILFYGTPRFTIMIIPFLIMFAAYSMVASVDWILAFRNAQG
jgi:4-amino-4-deoxy-L-arabinose transferase-like glycosyltransferase